MTIWRILKSMNFNTTEFSESVVYGYHSGLPSLRTGFESRHFHFDCFIYLFFCVERWTRLLNQSREDRRTAFHSPRWGLQLLFLFLFLVTDEYLLWPPLTLRAFFHGCLPPEHSHAFGFMRLLLLIFSPVLVAFLCQTPLSLLTTYVFICTRSSLMFRNPPCRAFFFFFFPSTVFSSAEPHRY